MGLNITDEQDAHYGNIVYSNIVNGYVTIDGVCYRVINHNDTNKILKIILYKDFTAKVIN